MSTSELRPQYEDCAGAIIKFPSALYAAIRDHVGHPFAVIEVCFTTPGSRLDVIQKVRAISVIGASALRAAKLHQDIIAAKRQSDALLEISQALAEEGDLDDIIQRILSVARDIVNAETVLLYLVDETTGDLVSSEDETEVIVKGEGIEGTVAEDQETVIINNSADEEGEGGDTRNIMCCPVVDSEGRTCGIIKLINKRGKEGKVRAGGAKDGKSKGREERSDYFMFQSTKINLTTSHSSLRSSLAPRLPHRQLDVFSNEDSVVVNAIGDGAGVALHRARLYDNIRAEQRKNDSMIRCMRAVKNSGDSIEKLMHNLVSVAYDIIEVQNVTLFLVDSAGGRLLCTVSKDDSQEGLKYPIGEGIIGRTASTGMSVRIDDCSKDERYDHEVDARNYKGTNNLLCHPIRDNRKNVVAVIELVNKKSGHFNQRDIDVLATFEDEVSTALKKAALELAAESGEGNMLGFINMYSTKLIGQKTKREGRRTGTVILQGQNLKSPRVGKRVLDFQDLHELEALESSLPKEKRHKELKKWEFDVLAYDKPSLVHCCLDMFDLYNVKEELDIEEKILLNFIVSVSKNYRDNSFHSFFHGAAVMHIAFMIMSETGADSFLQRRDCVSILIATLCHDLDHPGTTNDFQKNSLSNLALLYNDRSILENHHAATTFRVMKKDGADNDILSNCEKKDFAYIRKMIIELILKTDQAGHFDMVKGLQQLTDEKVEGDEFFDSNVESSR